jgi:hypothetical protein
VAWKKWFQEKIDNLRRAEKLAAAAQSGKDQSKEVCDGGETIKIKPEHRTEWEPPGPTKGGKGAVRLDPS